jgi:hypothetical protein
MLALQRYKAVSPGLSSGVHAKTKKNQLAHPPKKKTREEFFCGRLRGSSLIELSSLFASQKCLRFSITWAA